MALTDSNYYKSEGLDKKEIDKSGEVVVGGTTPQDIGWGYRHQQCAVLFCCLTVAYSMRACMGVSLVAMTDLSESENTSIVIDFNATDATEGGGIFNSLLFTPPYPKFNWSKKVQDAILASFFWGYMVLQVPAGMLAHRFGTRYLLTGALMINCVVSFCLPWAACYGGCVLTMIFRIMQGLSQSCIMPSMHTAFGKWTPLEERGRLTAYAYGGQALGSVIGMPITGFIAASPLGWPGIFRFYGVLSGLVGGLLWWFGADSPAQHKNISTRERKYIEDALGQSEQHKKLPVPWKRLLRSPGMYAIIVAHIGHTWGHVTLYSEVPAFMDKIMKVNIKANGLLTALPFFAMWLANFFFSYFTDMLIVRKILSVTHTRKLANTISCVPSAAGLIILGYVKKDIFVVETILVIVCACTIAANLGFHVNHIDIAPNFAGTMMSLSNFASNSIGSLAPIVASVILTDPNSEELWRKVFFVTAGMFFFTNLVYVIFGTAELADWNESEKENKDEEHLMIKKENCKDETTPGPVVSRR